MMDCYLKIKPNHKKVSYNIPLRYKERNNKFIFGETKIRSNEAYTKAYRKQPNLRLLDGFVKPEVATNESNSEIWDTDALALPSSSARSCKENDAKMYIKFTNSTNRQIINWPSKFLPRESELFKELTDIEKAAIRTDKAARDFADWWTDLGVHSTYEEKLENTETIKAIFKVGFDEHITRALTVNPKQMMVVPKDIAVTECQPQASVSATLKRQINCDLIAEKTEKKVVGFGKKLPLELIFIPPDNDTKRMWKDTRDVPKELDIMSTVWEDITNLKSSKGYYKWLREHPNEKLPPFLEDFYENQSEGSSVCDIKDLMETQKISKTLIPVMRPNIENEETMQKDAMNNLL